jgi:hypothetical protein
MSHRSFPYRLAAIDIDETLVGHDKKISAENHRAIKRLQSLGCRVVLASGRRYLNMLRYCRELELNDFVVATQGARVEHSGTGEVLHLASIEPSRASALVTEGLDRRFSVMLWLKDRVIARQPSGLIELYERLTEDTVSIEDLGPLAGEPAEKITWLIEPSAMVETACQMEQRLANQLLVTVTEKWSLEFSALTASKRDGVAAVARHLGIPSDAVMAFGDGNNDASMLAWAGMGVAMPHGRASARSAANMVAPEGDIESALARGVDVVSRSNLFQQAP